MNKMYAQGAYLLFCVVSLFVFPASVTFFATSIAAFFIYPPFAVFIGALSDIFYYSGGAELRATGIGILVCLLAYVVRYVIKARIM